MLLELEMGICFRPADKAFWEKLLSAIHPFWKQNLAPDGSEYLPLLERQLPIPKIKASDEKGRNSDDLGVKMGTPTATTTV